MKAVLASSCDAVFIDITHDIPRHDVRAGAYVLSAVARTTPAGTVHLAVVAARGEASGPAARVCDSGAGDPAKRGLVHVSRPRSLRPGCRAAGSGYAPAGIGRCRRGPC